MKQPLALFALLLFLSACGEYTAPDKVERALKEAFILERAEQGSFLLSSELDSFAVYDLAGKPLADQDDPTFNSVDPFPVVQVITPEDTLYLGQRNLQVEGVPNLRDIGGLRTKDGRQIKWNKIFRSGKLAELESAEFDRLAKLELQTILDFRSIQETEAEVDRWPGLESLNQVAAPIDVTNGKSQAALLQEINSEAFDAAKFMQEANRDFVLEQQKAYQLLFETLLEEGNYPLLYHCTAGKDRAGFATYLILSALGVAEQTILEDYLLSNYYLQDSSEEDIKKAAQFLGIDQDKLRDLMSVRLSFIQAATNAIKEHFGTTEAYLCQELKVCAAEIQQLQALLLY